MAAAFAALLLVIALNASVTEDAYIAFRTVDNATRGFGLRWNIHERVQAYTNPLWTLLHIPFYALYDNIFYVTLLLSAACTVGAVYVSLITFRQPWQQTIALFLLPLILSRSFTTYSTSGLENPLSHLLFALFGLALCSAHKYRWFALSFFAALALTNRLDTLFFYAPILLTMQRRDIRWRQCFAGSVPIVAWELFSLFYYGFFFPNTKYAKLDTGIAVSDYIRQGMSYTANLAATDIVSALFVAAAIFYGIVKIARKNASGITCVVFGIIAYSAYIVYVGGDHIAGRYWSLPVFASIWLIHGMSEKINTSRAMLIGVALLALHAFYPAPGYWKNACASCFKGAITDHGIRITLRDHVLKNTPLPEVNRDAASNIIIRSGIGIPGFKAGPNILIVDEFAIADPLLARLPAAQKNIKRIGHIARAMPEGYLYALHTGSLEQMDPALADYYARLRFVTSGDLWDEKRLRAILALNHIAR